MRSAGATLIAAKSASLGAEQLLVKHVQYLEGTLAMLDMAGYWAVVPPDDTSPASKADDPLVERYMRAISRINVLFYRSPGLADFLGPYLAATRNAMRALRD